MNTSTNILHLHRAKKFNIHIRSNNAYYEIFNIIFYFNSKNKFAIFVTFPYFKKNQGILSTIVLPAGKIHFKKISLIPSGKLVSHLIKYTHWEDGNTHFSQDGKVLTKVKNLSNPLTDTADHFFTIQLQNLNGFHKKQNKNEIINEKAIDLDFNIGETDKTKGIKFTGWWFHKKDITQNIPEGGPIVNFQLSNGSYKIGFIFAPIAATQYADFRLFLSCEIIPQLTKQKGTHLTFIGGFDPKVIANDLTKDLHALSFIYPAYRYNRLLKKLENIDLKITD